jgi:3-hydroxy-9,10-secoandrosta-1,3,5(10)-triene-9,17-dione monooxygenase
MSAWVAGADPGEEEVMTGTFQQTADAIAASHDEMVGRARALVPVLRERAAEADRLRKVPDANIIALPHEGLLKLLQSRRYGGYQMSLHTHIDVVAELGRGCPSTAWCVGVFHAHSWLMGLFPEMAQRDSYGTDPDAIVSAVIAPRGKARAVDGGFVLSGFWPFASGCEHSQWLLLGAVVEDVGGQAVDEGDLLVKTADVTVNDDWVVGGLRGTGSCSIVVKDVFVPTHRFLSLPAAIQGHAPGVELHDGTLYRAAAVPVLALALTPAALGAAELAFESFTARLPGREVAFTQREKQIEMSVTHLQVAEARTKIDVARLLLHHCADAIEAAAARGEEMAFLKRARVRMDCAHAVRRCVEAIETLYLASGGSGIGESNPTQRAWRDVHAIAMHGFLNLQTNQEMYGRVLLGLTPNTPLI